MLFVQDGRYMCCANSHVSLRIELLALHRCRARYLQTGPTDAASQRFQRLVLSKREVGIRHRNSCWRRSACRTAHLAARWQLCYTSAQQNLLQSLLNDLGLLPLVALLLVLLMYMSFWSTVDRVTAAVYTRFSMVFL